MTLKSDEKLEENLNCCSENDMRNSANFQQSTGKCQNWDFHGTLLPKVEKCISLKFIGDLCVMTMKNDTKIEEELTCHFKIDMRNLTNFDPITQKFPKFAFQMGYRGVIFHDTEK